MEKRAKGTINDTFLLQEDRMSYTDCESDFGSESVSVIKMPNEENGSGLSGAEYEQ